MSLESTKHVNGRMWQPGQSGNSYNLNRVTEAAYEFSVAR
jgi:hypothetical protein